VERYQKWRTKDGNWTFLEVCVYFVKNPAANDKQSCDLFVPHFRCRLSSDGKRSAPPCSLEKRSVCSWGGIRLRLPGTVACIVHIVHPPNGRQIERPTSRGSIPGRGERCIYLSNPRDQLWYPNSFWSVGTGDSFLGCKAVALWRWPPHIV
jgi:hypothetical protein